jgi:hypothetical protein
MARAANLASTRFRRHSGTPLAETTDLLVVAKQWAATDELQLSGWTVEETYEVLSNLARLAADARASGRNLWFYWSL